MIIEYLIYALLGVVKLLFGILPDLPDTPETIVNGGDWIIETIGGVISVLTFFLSPALMVACMFVIVAMFTFEHVYHGLMWILRKIPILNIK